MNYSATFGSFIRGGDYPLEADYIFNSVEELLQWCAENQGILHDGLLKIVKDDESQILYWCYDKEFYPLCDLNTFTNLEKLLEFIGKAETITDWIKEVDKQLHKGLHNLLKELDLTLLSIGLNPSGTLDPVCMNNTKYLIGARSIIGCLIELDKQLSKSSTYSLDYKDNTIYLLSNNEEISKIDASDFIKDGMIDSVVLEGSDLVITWNSDSDIEPTRISLSNIFNIEEYYTKEEIDEGLKAKLDASVYAVDKETFETKQHAEETYLKEHQDLTDIYDKLDKLFNWYEAD